MCDGAPLRVLAAIVRTWRANILHLDHSHLATPSRLAGAATHFSCQTRVHRDERGLVASTVR